MQEERNSLKYFKFISWSIFTLVLIFILIRYDELANLLAGVAILLIGMTNLGIGFKAFSGGLLEKILAKSTDTKIKSILFGTLSTLIMQSSTLVSIINLIFMIIMKILQVFMICFCKFKMMIFILILIKMKILT